MYDCFFRRCLLNSHPSVTMAVIFSEVAVSHSTCRGYIWFRSLSPAILACTSQILLIYRGESLHFNRVSTRNRIISCFSSLPVLVFYNWNFILKLFLGVLFLATNISIFVLLIIGILSYMIIPNPFPSLNTLLGACSTFSYPEALSNLWQDSSLISIQKKHRSNILLA